MTEKRACTNCGADGHLAAQCNWNKAGGAEGEREVFETWFLRKFYEGDRSCGLEWLSTEPCGGYRYRQAAELWEVWQARAALAQPSPAPELERHLQQEVDIMRIQRDAAQARVAELEKQQPAGYLRVVNGRTELADGPIRPADRSGGYATPWQAIYTRPVAQAGQVPDEVRTLLSRAQSEIEHLAECLENVCEDEEDIDVREDVADGRVVAADIAHMLAAAPAQGGE